VRAEEKALLSLFEEGDEGTRPTYLEGKRGSLRTRPWSVSQDSGGTPKAGRGAACRRHHRQLIENTSSGSRINLKHYV